ncbi:MAG TPA: RdgB/HAM1 family non-canonical purine NTP pyrophosphatase [Hyphomicrobiaceae bacterium]|jgi:XTP/dITP diphosphohydrolase
MPALSPIRKPRPLPRGARLVAATHNTGKVAELRDLLAPYALSVLSAAELGLPEPEETGATFTANAELKALAAAEAAGLPALADDSGLEVEALDGAPGIYSARWAGPTRNFSLAMQWLADEVRELGGWGRQPGPRANFTAVLCLAWPDGTADAFEGKVFGHLVWPPRGDRGFGYDPMFVADGETLTFGEMEPARKHAISHRARAFALFTRACLGGA